MRRVSLAMGFVTNMSSVPDSQNWTGSYYKVLSRNNPCCCIKDFLFNRFSAEIIQDPEPTNCQRKHFEKHFNKITSLEYICQKWEGCELMTKVNKRPEKRTAQQKQTKQLNLIGRLVSIINCLAKVMYTSIYKQRML